MAAAGNPAHLDRYLRANGVLYRALWLDAHGRVVERPAAAKVRLTKQLAHGGYLSVHVPVGELKRLAARGAIPEELVA